jgi:hypothetical protein
VGDSIVPETTATARALCSAADEKETIHAAA